MPTDTFRNLDPDKRDRIVDAAIEQFASAPYAQVSVEEVANHAGIAKGSIYQYFTHKRDLYVHLVETAATRQLSLLAEFTGSPPHDGLFPHLRELLAASLEVGRRSPAMTQLLRQASMEGPPLRDEVARIVRKQRLEFMRTPLIVDVEAQRVRADIDIDLMLFVLDELLSGIGDYLRHVGVDSELDGHQPTPRTATVVYDQLIDLLETGLAAPSPAEPQVSRRTPPRQANERLTRED